MYGTTRTAWWLTAAMLLSLTACDDGDPPEADAGPDEEVDASTPPEEDASTPEVDASVPPPDPVYVLHSAVQSTDDRLNYFTLVSSLTEDTEITYDASIEVPGRARLYATEGLGFFAIGDGEDVSLTRYDVEGDGTLTEGASLSFAALGVTSLGAQAVHFASPTVAYYKDPSQAQVIVWNPTTMEITDTIDLPASLVRADRRTSFGDWGTREGDAFFTVVWYSATYDAVDEGTALVHIDTETQEVTVTMDDRCRGLSDAAEIDGALYWFSNVINAFGHAVEPDVKGQSNCMLRVLPGEDTFDDAYVGDVDDALPTDFSGAVVTATGTDLWAQLVDLSVAPTAPGTTYSEWYADGWAWYRVPFEGTEATMISASTGAYSSFAVTAQEGAFVLSDTEADYSSTTLIDVAGGAPAEGLTFPGFALDVARVR